MGSKKLIDKVSELIENALALAQESRVSATLDACIRIARLRGDYTNLLWLEAEAKSVLIEETFRNSALSHYFSSEEFTKLVNKYLESYVGRRSKLQIDAHGDKVSKGNFVGYSVSEMEVLIESSNLLINHGDPPQGMHTLDLFAFVERQKKERDTAIAVKLDFDMILSRIKAQLIEFLTVTEAEVLKGQARPDLFLRTVDFVMQTLDVDLPAAKTQLEEATSLATSSEAESRAHSLTSGRRALKSLADFLYPPTREPVKGRDGKLRVLNSEMYRARLIQYASENVDGNKSSELLESEIRGICDRLDAADGLASKGVHDNVSLLEAEQCVASIIMLVGQLLRIRESSRSLSKSLPD